MSLITVRIYDVLRNLTHSEGFIPWNELIEKSYEKFFDFELPWYDDSGVGLTDFKKMYLNRNIMKEIGQETLEQHKQRLYAKLYGNLESYKQMYKAITSINILVNTTNVSYSEVLDAINTGNESQTREYNEVSEATGDTQSIQSDNPQVTFAQNDYASEMSRGETKTKQTGDFTDKLSADKLGERNESRKWQKSGFENSDLEKAVKAIQRGVYNINLTILKDCDNLFLGVW